MKRLAAHIPNFLTCCNLLSGCMAALCAFQHDALHTLVWVVAGALFDFCDGFAARLLHSSSPIGKELDSLADLVTFGFAPSLLCLRTMQDICPESSPVPYIAFLIVVFSALRLAKFNLDSRQSSSFIGLPVPANALFWCSLLQVPEISILNSPAAVSVIVAGFSLLLVSEIPMFSLKFKSLSFKENMVRWIFLLVSAGIVTAAAAFGELLRSLSVVVCWYIIFSLLTKGQQKC